MGRKKVKALTSGLKDQFIQVSGSIIRFMDLELICGKMDEDTMVSGHTTTWMAMEYR